MTTMLEKVWQIRLTQTAIIETNQMQSIWLVAKDLRMKCCMQFLDAY